MERLSRWTDAATCAVIAFGLIALAAGDAAPHGGEEHEPAQATSASTDFATPAPGSYALPPLGAAPAVRTIHSMVARDTGRSENMRTDRRRRMIS